MESTEDSILSSSWNRKIRKKAKISGQSYVNSRGKLVKAREIGPECGCKNNCYALVDKTMRERIFEEYYNLESNEEQNSYLMCLIHPRETAVNKSGRRNVIYDYYVNIDFKEVKVCRKAFVGLHGISIKKVRVIQQKMDLGDVTDFRGKHKMFTHLVKEHILDLEQRDKVDVYTKNGDIKFQNLYEDYLEKIESKYKISDKSNSCYKPKVSFLNYISIFKQVNKIFCNSDNRTINRKNRQSDMCNSFVDKCDEQLQNEAVLKTILQHMYNLRIYPKESYLKKSGIKINIKKLYKHYLKTHQPKGSLQDVSLDMYKRIFYKEFLTTEYKYVKRKLKKKCTRVGEFEDSVIDGTKNDSACDGHVPSDTHIKDDSGWEDTDLSVMEHN